MFVSAESVILHSIKYSNSSKIVTVFSREYGKLALIAKGARSGKSKLGSSLDALSHTGLYFNKMQGRDLYTLSNAELINPFNALHDSYDHLSVGLMLAETLYITQDKEAPNPDIFDYFIKSLTDLNNIQDDAFSSFVRFQLRLADEMGFGLELNFRENVNNEYFITLDNGTIYEKKPLGVSFIKISSKLLNKLLLLNARDSISKNLNFDKLEIRALAEFFAGYLSYHLDKKVFYKTLNLLMI